MTPRLPSLLPLFALLVAAATAFSQELTPSEQADFLRRLDRENSSRGGRTAGFVETRHSPHFKEPIVAKGRLYYSPPDFLRRDTESPAPASVRSDGEVLWMIYPDFAEAEKYRLDAAPPLRALLDTLRAGMDLSHLEKNFRISAWKRGGEIELRMIPRGALKGEVRSVALRIDPSLRASELDLEFAGGGRTRTRFLDETDFSAPPDFFRFTPPPDVRVSEPLGKASAP